MMMFALVRRCIRTKAKKDLRIISVIQYQKPRAIGIIAKPFVDELKCISIWIIMTRKSKLPSNIFVRFLESGAVAGVDPEYLCLGMTVSISVTVLDCDP